MGRVPFSQLMPEAEPAATAFLHVVHRLIRFLQKRFRRYAVFRIARHPDADPAENRLVLHCPRLVEPFKDEAGQTRYVVFRNVPAADDGIHRRRCGIRHP